jgi:hypothetical protein
MRPKPARADAHLRLELPDRLPLVQLRNTRKSDAVTKDPIDITSGPRVQSLEDSVLSGRRGGGRRSGWTQHG